MIEEAGGAGEFELLLARQGMSREAMLQTIRQGHQVDLLIEKLTQGLPDPTEAEMKQHFAEHAHEYRTPPRAQAQHILVKASSTADADKQVARSRLEDIRKKVEDGASFTDMASAYSECPSGKSMGGSLGWISRGVMLPAFDEALFSLEVGQLSGVVESPLGFHLVRKIGHEEGREAEFEEVRDKVRDFLRHVRRGEVIASYVADLKAKAVIEED
jgi:parvulin-like peptidyl-prolyl isomerase